MSGSAAVVVPSPSSLETTTACCFGFGCFFRWVCFFPRGDDDDCGFDWLLLGVEAAAAAMAVTERRRQNLAENGAICIFLYVICILECILRSVNEFNGEKQQERVMRM